MMQPFNFGLRQSGEGLEPSHGRHKTTSSIYSGGPGPAEEITQPTSMYSQEPLRNPFKVDQPRYNPLNQEHPRSSSLLNMNDPVAMHLLMETAMIDSKEYEILSFEEVEKLKKENSLLRNRTDAVQRKLGLENKLRDAAQSLNRLYSTNGRSGSSTGMNGDNSSQSPKRHRRSLLGSKGSNNLDAQTRADDEFTASNRKIEELTQELNRLEKRHEDNQKRILEHTAGILQMTHKGLKKNIRKNELPRSPESMASLAHRSMVHDGVDEFDERSFYQIPDYVTDFGRANGSTNGHGLQMNTQALQDTEKRLVELSNRLHALILQADPEERVESPPVAPANGAVAQPGNQINAHLRYMNIGLDAMEAAQAKTVQDAQKSIFDSEDRLEDINVRLHEILEKTNTVGAGPTIMPGESRGKSMQTQLAFSTMVLDRLSQRVEHLIEQKDILGRQIQQQRELNTKSDAQRDAQITDLTEELAETKRLHTMAETESQKSLDQMNLFMEQLDLAKQESVLQEQQRGVDLDKALQLEKKARKETEENLLADLKWTQDHNNQMKGDLAKLQDEFEIRSQQHIQTTNGLTRAKDEIGIELATAQAELSELQKTHATQETEVEKLESDVVRLQTELTVAKAELDGAYGTRAQRAADVSMNPAIQKEIDDLTAKNASLQSELGALQTQHETKEVGSAELQTKVNKLQKELKDTIEDYELMTKQSIESERERDQLEATIDTMRERSEGLETQLSDERVKWLGAKSSAPTETTSTMVLKNEFKKMMRDTRTENMKALRAEQEERRRLETLIRSMKKEAHLHTPTKSSLNQSITADD